MKLLSNDKPLLCNKQSRRSQLRDKSLQQPILYGEVYRSVLQ